MVDRVLLSASPANIQSCVDLAVEHGLGIEVMAFAYPSLLDGDWAAALAEYKNLLSPVRGMIALHGPFMDMAPGSPDARIRQICIDRYQHAIRIAEELGVEVVVFHANFIAAIQSESYRRSWQDRNVDFWSMMAEYAQAHRVMLAIENMWEFDPDIIGDVLERVNHAHIRACLDVGHAHLFSRVPFERWLRTLEPYLVHLHLNNNDGWLDVHQGLDDGVLIYETILPMVRALSASPTLTLEMDRVEDMRASLRFLKLPQDAAAWRSRVISE